jgi:hypothetical protein
VRDLPGSNENYRDLIRRSDDISGTSIEVRSSPAQGPAYRPTLFPSASVGGSVTARRRPCAGLSGDATGHTSFVKIATISCGPRHLRQSLPLWATVGHPWHVNLGDVPTWIASIGTVGALIAALIQINTERKRRHSDEVKDRHERRISQARLIAAFLGSEETRGRPDDGTHISPRVRTLSEKEPDRTPIYLLNSSTEPVYQPVIALVCIQGTAPRTIESWLETRKGKLYPVTTASILPPGKSRVWVPGSGWSRHLSGRSSAEIAFTDSAGIHWIRRSDGCLEEIPDSPLKYFSDRGLPAPFELQTPESILYENFAHEPICSVLVPSDVDQRRQTARNNER